MRVYKKKIVTSYFDNDLVKRLNKIAIAWRLPRTYIMETFCREAADCVEANWEANLKYYTEKYEQFLKEKYGE